MAKRRQHSPKVVLSAGHRRGYDAIMALEIARLWLGLLVAGFHARIADFILKQEYALILACGQRGIVLPAALPRETARNIYFTVGITVALLQLFRLYQMVR